MENFNFKEIFLSGLIPHLKKSWWLWLILALVGYFSLYNADLRIEQADNGLLANMSVERSQNNSVAVEVTIFTKDEEETIDGFEIEFDSKSYSFKEHYVMSHKERNEQGVVYLLNRYIFPDIQTDSIVISPGRPNWSSEPSKTFVLN